jgi:hypothetical protein
MRLGIWAAARAVLAPGLTLVLALVLAGCLPVTGSTPVGTTVGLGHDPALYGSWRGHTPGDPAAKDGFVHFLAEKDSTMTAVLALADGGRDDGWTVFRITTATLGGHHLMNAGMLFDKGAPAEGKMRFANVILLYTVEGKTLTLSLLDEDKTKAAVQAGALKGTVGQGRNGDVILTGSAGEIDAYFAKPEAAALFKPMLVMQKVE